MRVKIVYDLDDSCGREPHPYSFNPRQDYGGMAHRMMSGGGGAAPGKGLSAMNQFTSLTKNFTKQDESNSDLTNHVMKTTKDPSKRQQFRADVPYNSTTKSMSKHKLTFEGLKSKFLEGLETKKYELMKKKLLEKGEMFTDKEFPPEKKSIGDVQVRGEIEWKRCKDINPDADFIIDEVDRFDIEQGQLGDCWLLAVISSISSFPHLFDYCVPKGQCFKDKDYCGLIRFRFWQFGHWEDVIIDDYLPVVKGTNRLVFMHSRDSGEMWSALMEKAYAKVNGCYANLNGGSQSEAMEDMTGGMCETIDLEKADDELKSQLIRFTKRCCLMGTSITSQRIEGRRSNGLVEGHAYSVTGLEDVDYKGNKVTLVRCRNPWGNSVEWNGAWSDRSSEWDAISDSEKKRLDINFGSDGEFWMTLEDFVTNFSKLEVCYLGLESMEADETIHGKRRLEEKVFTGEWLKNANAGGCINNRDSFYLNPQYMIKVSDPDPNDDDNKSSVMIGLMQKDARALNNGQFFSLGFMVYKVDDDHKGNLSKTFFSRTRHVTMSEFANKREVIKRLRLDPGTYVIVPSTFKPNEEVKFLIRVMTQVLVEDEEVDNENKWVGFPQEISDAVHSGEHGHEGDEQVKAKFNELKNEKGLIDAYELVEILNGSEMRHVKGFNGFNVEMCRSFIAALDKDISGRMDWDEFNELWEHCEVWKHIFATFDKDGCGHFDAFEFRDAINQTGYKICNRLFATMVHRFCDAHHGEVSFEDYILCMTRIKTAFENMNAQPVAGEGTRLFSEEDYLRYAIYI